MQKQFTLQVHGQVGLSQRLYPLALTRATWSATIHRKVIHLFCVENTLRILPKHLFPGSYQYAWRFRQSWVPFLLLLSLFGSLNFYPATIILSLPLGAEMMRILAERL